MQVKNTSQPQASKEQFAEVEASHLRVAMGVTGYMTWFTAKYPSAFSRFASSNDADAPAYKQTGPVDHLYIDMGSLLHNVLRKGAFTSPLSTNAGGCAALRSHRSGALCLALPHRWKLRPVARCSQLALTGGCDGRP